MRRHRNVYSWSHRFHRSLLSFATTQQNRTLDLHSIRPDENINQVSISIKERKHVHTIRWDRLAAYNWARIHELNIFTQYVQVHCQYHSKREHERHITVAKWWYFRLMHLSKRFPCEHYEKSRTINASKIYENNYFISVLSLYFTSRRFHLWVSFV